MSEEDKEIIKSLKTQCKGAREIFKDTCCQLPISYIEKIIDIVDKQQKEIEELKKPKYMMNFETGTITTIDNNFISKDKIREKIKELEQIQNTALTETTIEIMNYKIDILKLLLEE